jgi:UDP-N-acetylglucosamine 2-epimerase (non-hydrolysing)
VDAVKQNLEIAERKVNILEELGLTPRDYFLVTAHRQENVDVKERLKGIRHGLEMIGREFSLPVVFPVHPRTRKMIEEFGISLDGIKPIDPVGFLEFLELEANARLVLTDSGGVQEETCILGVPCVTLRDNTERPETLDVGSNMLAGTSPSKIMEKANIMLSKENGWMNPFGDGLTGKRIIELLNNYKGD